MTRPQTPGELQMIPIDQIEVLNPRDRNERVFDEIVGNIRLLGLKKPVTVTPRVEDNGRRYYLLICGEGRLKAFRALGETTIPAMVVQVDDEDAFIMSLAENIARRQARSLELLAGIEQLRKQGYDCKAIAKKIGLTSEYIHGIVHLLEHGEERLLVAVEGGRISLNVALAIAGAGSNDKAIQAALQDAYEKKELRGSQLLQARRVIERRSTLGRSLSHSSRRRYTNVTSASLVRTYQQEVDRQKLLVRKAELAQQRLLFVTEALRQLLTDENFTNLLRAEGLDTLPKYLADRVWPMGRAA
ncbi:MAG: ParB/RepB/Spo0J family partition protein [Burkholderiales bacterium]|nr:ParB/RepB/Spo0J family partition protein [Roseateles sp.]MBV8658495.1 ParB/RepB/Spo0J family partition protein [Burkholderiales bacterium]